MKFTSNTIGEILSELEKIPNIRYVCSKVGINHSTFYRWLIKHPTFNKEVMKAMFIGKRAICGTAETVIIKGVQNGDFRASTFYLSHNDPNYMQKDKGQHYSLMLDNMSRALSEKVKLDGSNFESIFKLLDTLTETYGEEVAINIGKLTIEHVNTDDPQLVDICLAAYERYRAEKSRQKELLDDLE